MWPFYVNDMRGKGTLRLTKHVFHIIPISVLFFIFGYFPSIQLNELMLKAVIHCRVIHLILSRYDTYQRVSV